MTICQIITSPPTACRALLSNAFEEKIVDTSNPFELVDGWQKITIDHNGSYRFDITDILLDGNSIRENIYTAWFTDSDNINHQPKNYFDHRPGTWTFIVHSDPGLFKERLCDQITNGDFGENLFEKYQVFVDLGTKLKHSFNSELDSFFARAQGINFYPKDEYPTHPYIPLDIDIDREQIFNEVKSLELTPVGNNVRHFRWESVQIKEADNPTVVCSETDKLPLPNVKKLLTSLGIEKFNRVSVFLLKPGGYIDLHRDQMRNDTCTFNPDIGIGIRHFYISLVNDGESKIKLGGAGVMHDGVVLINNGNFTHGGVNDGDSNRYVIIINGDHNKEFVDRYKINKDVWEV